MAANARGLAAVGTGLVAGCEDVSAIFGCGIALKSVCARRLGSLSRTTGFLAAGGADGLVVFFSELLSELLKSREKKLPSPLDLLLAFVLAELERRLATLVERPASLRFTAAKVCL